MRQAGWPKRLKRTIDLVLATNGLLVLTPIMALAGLAVRVSMGSPVFFRQQRPGLEGRPFTLFKLRTMLDQRDADGRLLPDAARMNRVGQTLRGLSLDEIPQLWNVLRGEMSLVGPRPLLMEYLPRYNPRQARRHDVLPGITGWAQVNGRNGLTHEEKFELDVWYVENWSLALDARILWLTLRPLARRSGITATGHASMPLFMGASPGSGKGSFDPEADPSSC